MTKQASIPLADFLRQEHRKDPLGLFQKIFPDLDQSELESIGSLTIAISLRRQNSSLAKMIKWSPAKGSAASGFSESAMRQFLSGIESVANNISKLGVGWTVDNLDVSAKEIVRNWDMGVRMHNHAAWMASKDKNKVFAAPPAEEKSTKVGFDLRYAFVVTNPERPGEVWQSSAETSFPSDFFTKTPDEQKKWWSDLLKNDEEVRKAFGFDQFPRLMRPDVRVKWTALAPDGSRAFKPDPTKSWTSNPAAQGWMKLQEERIEAAYKRVGFWAFLKTIEQQEITLHPEKSNELIAISDRVTNELIEKGQWDLIDQENIRDLQAFDQFMLSAKDHSKDKIKTYILEAMTNFIAEAELSADGHEWTSLALARDGLAARPWADDQFLVKYIENEQSAFIKTCAKANVMSKIEKMDDAAKEDFYKMLLWSGCDFAPELVEKLIPSSTLSENNQVDAEVSSPKNENSSPRPAVTAMNWDELLSAFEVTALPDDEVNEDRHPFVRWMKRLNAPSEVHSATLSWLYNNEKFNDINRLILRKKDAAEASLNADLVNKLKAVMDVSNNLLQESDKSGGWWSRVRKNFNTENPEKWADTFLDFQNHMLTMFNSINEQVERDRVWLKYADELMKSASDVDRQWAGWLSSEARALNKEREEFEKNGGASSEVKMQWNNRADALDSAQSAHEHIKTANGITGVMLQKIKQSTDIKERLQQRTMMFYWSSLNMFAGLQSIQRNTNSVFEQSEMVQAMADSFQALSRRTLLEEQQQKEKIRAAFKQMAQSEQSMHQFYETIATFQRDTIQILGDLNAQREGLQEETAEVALSAQKVKRQRKAATISVAESQADPQRPATPPSRNVKGM